MAPAWRALAFATAFAVAATGGGPVLTPAQAQATRGMPIIRDTEIEQLLRDYAAPVLRAAGLAKQNVKVVVLNDRAFNAFVMDGRHIFINAGALFDAKTPNEIIGVFAHEGWHQYFHWYCTSKIEFPSWCDRASASTSTRRG